MKTTIKSKVLNQAITFSVPGDGYIYADLNGREGSLGRQICEGGDTVGSAMIFAGEDPAEFKRVCRNWYRAYVRSERRAMSATV